MTDWYNEECCECGIAFAFPKTLHHTLCNVKPGRNFYCPNGHSQHYVGESDKTKLRREQERNRQREVMHEDEKRRLREMVDAEKRSAAAYKGAATRMKNRAKAGVCPCCNRTFQNLARHMASQHPEAETDNVVEIGQATK